MPILFKYEVNSDEKYSPPPSVRRVFSLQPVCRSASARYSLNFSSASDLFFLTVYPMKNKSDALEKFKEYLSEAERQTGCRLKTLRTDGGGEYFSSEFTSYLKSIGITHESTNLRTPQENGVAERVNRTLVTMAIAMLKSVESKVGHTAWPYVI